MIDPSSYNRPNTRFRRGFTDKVFQKPNLPLVVWIFSWFMSKILPYGTLNFIFALIAFGAGFTWAWLELFQGVNLFRRLLGFTVLVMLIASQVS